MFIKNLNIIKDYKAYLVVGVGCLLATVVLFSQVIGSSTNNNEIEIKQVLKEDNKSFEELAYLSTDLNNISSKLNKIEEQLGRPAINIEPIQQQLSSLAVETEKLSNNSRDIIRSAIDTANEDLREKLSNIENELADLKEKQKVSTYIKAENLPFETLHIDNIQGQSVVTVRYNSTIFPMTVGDYLAGWKLVKAEFNNQEVEYINSKEEHILLSFNNSFDYKVS